MKTKLGLTCVTVCAMTFASVFSLVACGDAAAKGGPADTPSAGAGGDGTGGADSTHVGGANTAGTSTQPHAGSSSTGARPNVDPGGPNDPAPPGDPSQAGAAGAATDDGGADSLVFDGIDLKGVPKTAPTGCVGGFDTDTGTLSIELDAAVRVVHLAVHAGVVQANGIDCTSAAAEPASADKVLTLDVKGGPNDNVVYLDLSDEPFTGCFSADGAITIALGDGADGVSILGTNDADTFQLGTDADQLVLDLTGDKRVDVSIAGTPAVVLSTGAKSDDVRADGVALGVAPAALPLAIYGGGARDKLVGGAAADRLFGGIGDDWFDAGSAPAGADSFDGGDGRDTVDFSARTEPLTLTVGQAADDGEAGEGTDVTSSVETVYGGQGTNDMTADKAGSTLWGGAADDVLTGGPGGDTLNGGKGNDTITGGDGDDYLYGDEGDDALDGGNGDDLLDGSAGSDTLKGGLGDGDICFVTKSDTAQGCEL